MLSSRNHISVNEQPKMSLRLKTKHLLRRLQAFNVKHVLWSVSPESKVKHITEIGETVSWNEEDVSREVVQ